MVSTNEVLDEKFYNMKEQNEKEHKALFSVIEKLDNKMGTFIDSADHKYATIEKVVELELKLTNNQVKKANIKVERIKSWGVIIVAIITMAGVLLTR